MTTRQKAILIGVFRDREQYAAKTPRYVMGDHALARERDRIFAARDGFVECAPSRWLGMGLTPSLSVMVCQCYKQLAAKGLIVKAAFGYDGTRTTHLALTEAGEAAAKELLAAEDAATQSTDGGAND